MDTALLSTLARRTRRLVGAGRGLLAADTRPAVLAARFRAVSVVAAEPSTHAYWEMLLETAGLASTTSGVVLAPEAFPAFRLHGRPVADALRAAGVLAGVRADTGHETLLAAGRDQVTSGLDGLTARLAELRGLGVEFAVWSVCTSVTRRPGTLRALAVNAQAAARFASICQDLGIVPLIRVGTRTCSAAEAGRHAAAAAAALLSVVEHLVELEVDLAATVIGFPGVLGVGVPDGPGLPARLSGAGAPDGPGPVAGPGAPVEPGTHEPGPAAPSLVGLTLGPLGTLPPGLGGVVLADPPQLPPAAAAATADLPWPVTFYLGRAATWPALQAWRGRPTAIPAAQRALRTELGAAALSFGAASPLRVVR